ncbi:MAG: hypothetical protein COA67_04785 [Lutibacter sp.]|nr:MAG: hypothetical protein COA67_04785 [Lutibacter sp.]
MKKITLLFFTISLFSFSQTTIKGFVFDESTRESLPYATIRLLNTKDYTITNEDGKFEISSEKITSVDSLEVRFMGFEKKRIAVSYFKTNLKLYLTPQVSLIDRVDIYNKGENYKYDLLNRLIQKCRKNELITESKAFLSLTSSARNVPIEHIEGFYNSKQSVSSGLENLSIKSGRFGQNKSFPFYSLDNTVILKNFQFFKKNTEQILPLYPGNMSQSAIKSKYIVTIEDCNQCDIEDVSISFVPKKFNGRLFSGKIIFDESKLIVKKIALWVDDPKTKGLSTLKNKDIFIPKKIKLDVVFNPLDINKVQYLDFSFDIRYNSEGSSEYIKSQSFLYFYDYQESFKEPHFTNGVVFKNDYDKIIALQTSEGFWKENYQFPESIDQMRSLKFMKEHGYLINYDNTIPVNYIKYINPSVVSWGKDKRLSWKSIKAKDVIGDSKNDPLDYSVSMKEQKDIKADKVSHSSSGSRFAQKNKREKEKFTFDYVLDFNKNKKGVKEFTARTIFNRNNSFYKGSESDNKLTYINLIFDVYEHYRQEAEDETHENLNYEEVKTLYNKKFNEASETVNQIKKKTNLGKNYQNLIVWSNKIKNKFNVDNYTLQDNTKTAIIEPFQKDALYREKVFVHTNKTTYFVNDNIWFTAYVGRDSDNSPSDYTSNLEVRLLNSKGDVLKKKTVFIKKGVGIGDFLLDENLSSGSYYIESSTNFMKNFGKDNVYLQKINIINPSSKNIVEKSENKYDLQVFPESGYLLEEAENTIGLKALINGKGTVFTGKIEDSKGKVVTTFKGNVFGMSRSSFYYKQDEVYTAIVEINGTTQRVSLPKAQKTGVVFNIDNTDEAQVKLTLKTNKKTFPSIKSASFAIVFYRNNQIREAVTLSLKSDTEITQDLFFDKNKLLNGVNTVTLFKNNQPIAERKFFVNKSAEQTTLLVEKLKEEKGFVNYKITTGDSKMQPFSAQLSVSTLPINSKVFKETQNIKSAFLLSPYVKGTIENPSYYFSNANDREQEFLDLLLLNQGWSTYTLQEKIEEVNPKKEFDFEKGFTINGTVKKFPKGYDIAILSKQNKLAATSEFSKTNKFSFEKIFAYKGDTTMVAFIKKDKPLMKPSNISFSRDASKLQNLSFLLDKKKRFIESTIVKSKEESNSFPMVEKLDVVTLKKIKNKKEKTIYDKEDNIAVKRKVIAAESYKNKKVTEEMESRFETVFDYLRFLGFVKTSTHGNIYLSLRNVSGSLSTSVSSLNPDGTHPPKVYVNNNSIMSANFESVAKDLYGNTISTVNSGGRKQNTSGAFSANVTDQGIEVLKNLKMTEVDEILINRLGAGGGARGMGGIIKIYTKEGNHQYYDQPTKKLYENLVLLTGFDRATEYYKPLYNITTKNTLNWTEIDWKNSLQTDNNGEIIIKVPTNKFSNDHQLIINGFSKEGLLFHYIYKKEEDDF